MATQNAIDANKPVSVDDGGTGAATLTDHGVLVGSGTSPITALSVGATGTLLVGTVSADPTFATSATGDFTFTSSTVDQTRNFTLSNTDNTAAATSAARMNVTVGGALVGDAQLNWVVTGQTTWSNGVDNTNDGYKIAASATLGTTDVFFSRVSGGEITKPLQPAFLAQIPSGGSVIEVTGDGTIYSYICTSEIFDQNNDYNTGTGQFTAPVTGRYMLIAGIRLSGVVAASAEEGAVYINTSNRRYRNGENRGTALGDFEMICATLVDMDASDVAYPQTSASGGTKTVGAFGFTDPAITCFAGFLAC